MKKTLFILVLGFMAINVSAQDKMYVGGEIGLSFLTENEISIINISPLLGYKINDNVDIGSYIGYTYTQRNDDANVEDKASYSFSVAPFVRYYFAQKGAFRMFLDFGAGYSYTDKIYNIDRNRNGFEIGMKPGFTIKLHDKIRLYSIISFIGYRKDYKSFDNGYYGELSLNNIGLGLIVNL